MPASSIHQCRSAPEYRWPGHGWDLGARPRSGCPPRPAPSRPECRAVEREAAHVGVEQYGDEEAEDRGRADRHRDIKERPPIDFHGPARLWNWIRVVGPTHQVGQTVEDVEKAQPDRARGLNQPPIAGTGVGQQEAGPGCTMMPSRVYRVGTVSRLNVVCLPVRPAGSGLPRLLGTITGRRTCNDDSGHPRPEGTI